MGRDARRLGLPHLSVVPCLIVTVPFGPASLFTYFVVRIVQGHGISLFDPGKTGTEQV